MKNALGVSLGICALVWTYIAVFVNGLALVWAGFIAWGAYFTVGKDALKKTIWHDLWFILALSLFFFILYLGMLGDFAWPVAVGITVWGLTAVPKFSDIPALV